MLWNWHCWLVVTKSVRPVDNWVMRCWCGYLSDARCRWFAYRWFHAQRFYLNLLPVLGFVHHSTDLDEPDKPVASVFLISQHRKSYKPSKNGAICASAYLLCAQRFYRSAIFDRTFVPTLIALCIADRSGTKVLCANFIANPVLHRAQRFYLQR